MYVSTYNGSRRHGSTGKKILNFGNNLVILPDDMDDKTIFHQIINSNKVTNMHDILLVFTDKKKFENLNIILKNAGLNPTLYEPKCFFNF